MIKRKAFKDEKPSMKTHAKQKKIKLEGKIYENEYNLRIKKVI